MPVKSSFSNKLDDYIAEMANIDLHEFYQPSEFVLSEDIWNKFELPHGNGLLEDVFSEFDMNSTMLTSLLNNYNEISEIRNHDCMWAGHCGSKEHPSDELKPSRPLITTVSSPAKQATVPAGRSLLLTTQPQTSQQTSVTPTSTNNPVLPTIDSPPNSDDEEVKSKTTTLQLLQDAISECDLEDDSDLYDYFEDEDLISETIDEEEEPPSKQPIRAPSTNVAQFTSDHCYHKDKNATMRMNNLGIETPSDSEEEIDVVSVGDKHTVMNRMVCTLPNNPTNRDKQHLQRTMASAMTKNGIKTMLPRKPATIEQRSLGKRRAIESRGIKRTKHRSPPSSPYKRRSYNHSSDSEPEPSEKRNMHNNMERQRRIDLRNAFEDLRLLVPEVSKRERAPKVVILREAAMYCDQLGNVKDGMNRQVEDLRRQQKRLRARVSQLRLSLAAKHR